MAKAAILVPNASWVGFTFTALDFRFFGLCQWTVLMQLPLFAVGVAKEHKTEIFKITTLTFKTEMATVGE